ncbi:MAG: PAS domain S-box protein, partial [Proteobacteria bacterium]|nr:PAS domain S-box protein [Pseudomonadota bacterium]
MPSQSSHVIDALFKAFTDASSDIIHLNDEQGNILYVNQASEKLLGYPENELLHTPAFNLIHEEDRPLINEDMRIIAPNNALPAREIRLKKKDGSYLDVEVQGFFVLIEERRLLGAVIRDISVRKAREEQTQLLTKKKLESVGVLAGGIAHDFNNL